MACLEGYNRKVEEIRSTEFPNLEGNVYLDHAGTTLYSRSQMEAVHSDLMSNLYGNPHSHSVSSSLTTDAIDQVRYRVLRFLNTSPEEYTVIFTSGCTGSLQLLAECFGFGKDASESREKSSETVNLQEDSPHPRGDNKSHLSDLHSKYRQYPQNDTSGRRGRFCYLLDNHTSVQGMREIAASKGAEIICFEEADLMGVSEPEGTHQAGNREILESNGRPTEFTARGLGLWAIPAQSNFSGRKYSLGWLSKAKNGQFRMQKSFAGPWFTLLDSAAFTSTSPLDLSQHKPDFVTLSFYKIFGYPTGLGALVVHKDALWCLEKTYYGGGTIAVSTAKSRFHVHSPKIPERFEDGTVSFLDIIALRHGFDALDRIGGGMAAISRHTFTLARYFHHQLRQLRHGNGRPLAVIYCNDSFDDAASQGAIVNFNLLRANGSFAGFAEVDKLAQLHGIHLRTGCFCNIGACQIHLNMTEAQIRKNFSAGHVCGDNKDLVDGLPTGSVRISFGYMSTLEDTQKCLQFIADCFLEEVPVKPVFSRSDCRIPSSQSTNQNHAEIGSSVNHQVSQPIISSEDRNPVIGQTLSNPSPPVTDPEKTGVFLTNIYLYPVKSCGAFAVEQWELCPTGFLYDRNWMIVNEGGVSLGQKREPKLCLLRPEIHLDRKKLILKYPGMNPLELPLDAPESSLKSGVCCSKVCGDRINGTDCGDEVSDWLREALGRPGCRLIQKDATQERRSKLRDAGEGVRSVAAPMALTNQSQFLLISRASIRSLQEKLRENQAKFQDEESIDTENLIDRFRGNLVVEGGAEFAEEDWSSVRVGAVSLVSQGRCSRCQMISMDQRTGNKSNEPLRTLGSWRGGKIPFGIYLRWVADTSKSSVVKVGDSLVAQWRTGEVSGNSVSGSFTVV